MNASELVRYVTDVLFAAVFVAVVARAIRDRRRAAVDAALTFGSIALIVLESEALRILGADLPQIVDQAVIGIFLAAPYFFLRLVDDLAGVPPRAMLYALVGFALSWAALVFVPPPLPLPILLGVVGYFGAFEIYGAVLLVRESVRATGIVRQRARAAALGSVLLGATLLVAGFQQLAPLLESVTRVLILGSAVAYVAAMVPIPVLKRAWLEPELRAFLGAVATISLKEDRGSIVAELEPRIARAMGAAGASIDLAEDGGRVTAPTMEERRADPRARPTAVLAAPLVTPARRLGTVRVETRRVPLFPDDDLALLALLADQAARVLEGARLYADLAAVNQHLEDATRAKTEFLANMSHELRTPMNAILGFSDLLVEQLGGKLTPPQERYFRNIKDAGSHLLELINEVLDLSKVEAGRLELRPEPIRISALVEPVIDSIRRAAQAKGLAFEAAFPGDAVVRLDPGRVRQVLYNLLSNAVKFTPAGRVDLRLRLDGQALVIEVADSGIGIPAGKYDRVFGTFERLHEGTVEVGGTGLGLALTKKLVELHQGTIGFDSEEGHGTTFRVRIADAVFAPVSGARILVIDDTARDAELIAAVASQLDIPTELVATVRAGRDAIRRDMPLGVVLDLRLPDERGYVLLEELKADPATKSLPVLVMSVEDDEGRSRRLGADDHLTKPIDRDRLAAWMRKVMAHPSRDLVGARL
jgi:signal transduction histidine kinase